MMTDMDVEHYLLQLQSARESEAAYKSVADKIEEQLDAAGITYRVNTAGASWRRTSSATERP
jgi:hypothetical protein